MGFAGLSVVTDPAMTVFPSRVGRNSEKIFFVGDNRRNINWGRGASVALREMLSASFEISGCIGGEWFDLATAEAGFVGTLIPGRYYRAFQYLQRRRTRRPFSWYYRLETLFGAKDFIREDPTESVRTLLAQKHRYPALERVYDEASKAEIMVLDGDGDIVFSTPPRRHTLFLLAMIELGIQLGKPVFLVNSMISDCPLTGRNERTLAQARQLLAQCRAVCLRDPESFEYVRREMPEVKASLIPDSLFSWYRIFSDAGSRPPVNGNFCIPYPEQEELWDRLDFSEPYICIGGGALAGTQPKKAIESYSRLVDALLRLGHRVCFTENDAPDVFLREVAHRKSLGIVPADAPILLCGAILAHARLFISGRYHPSIFASLGGTPCIFMGSLAHKMGSLSRVLEYEVHREFSAFPTDAEIDAIVTMARHYLDQGEMLRERIKRIARSRSEEAMILPTLLEYHMRNQVLA
jgi:polysaccharide pyruvyl transferase WcaK-like protein